MGVEKNKPPPKEEIIAEMSETVDDLFYVANLLEDARRSAISKEVAKLGAKASELLAYMKKELT